MTPFRTQVAGAVGSVLEWYDFAIFGFLAPFMGPLFFPDEDPIVALIQTYGVFAIGYLMRPLGGVLFGAIGGILLDTAACHHQFCGTYQSAGTTA